MMIEGLGKIDPNIIAQIMGPEEAAAPTAPVMGTSPAGAVEPGKITFDDILGKAVSALENVSAVENHANVLMQQYAAGEAELSDVMIASAKMNIAVQLAVTTVTSAVNTFKEITQMQI